MAAWDIPTGTAPAFATATGLVNIRTRWPLPNTAPDMPWVDLDGNPITDTRPYPTAKATVPGSRSVSGNGNGSSTSRASVRSRVDFLPRSDGGVVIVLHTSSRGPAAQAINVLQLSPDGTIERYFVDTLWPIGAARRLVDRRTRSPAGPPHPSRLTSIPRGDAGPSPPRSCRRQRARTLPICVLLSS